MEFGYYNFKGLAEPLRWIFLHFDINVIEWNPATPDDLKSKLNYLDDHTLFPALPYLKDGNFVVTHPSAIPQYLLEKSGNLDFLGKTEQDRARVQQINGMLADIRAACLHLITNSPPNIDHKAEIAKLFDYESDFDKRIENLSKYLGEKDWLLGYMTLADFMLTFTARFTGAICYSQIGRSPYANFPNIVNLMARVSELPGIKERLMRAIGSPYWPKEEVPFKLYNYKQMIDEGFNPI